REALVMPGGDARRARAQIGGGQALDNDERVRGRFVMRVAVGRCVTCALSIYDERLQSRSEHVAELLIEGANGVTDNGRGHAAIVPVECRRCVCARSPLAASAAAPAFQAFSAV